MAASPYTSPLPIAATLIVVSAACASSISMCFLLFA
jgi:hypothetical protein